MDRGHIYKGSYEGWYSVADESFVPESQVETLVKDGLETKVRLRGGECCPPSFLALKASSYSHGL